MRSCQGFYYLLVSVCDSLLPDICSGGLLLLPRGVGRPLAAAAGLLPEGVRPLDHRLLLVDRLRLRLTSLLPRRLEDTRQY
jgi:hypothetical protein